MLLSWMQIMVDRYLDRKIFLDENASVVKKFY